MEIYIVRHGIAEDVSPDGSDESRALTDEGRRKMKEEAEGFARLERKIERIFSSPLVRARQTAEFIASPLKLKVEEMRELAPGHRPQEVCIRLQQIKKLGSVMVVGHEPNCSELVSYLLTGGDSMNIEFKKGAISLLESGTLAAGSGDLIWHLSPQTLRLMRNA
jgi:phosphohistidine phosphatase